MVSGTNLAAGPTVMVSFTYLIVISLSYFASFLILYISLPYKGGQGDDDLGVLLTCYYCSNVQHEECVPLSCPGKHQEMKGEWVCCACWSDYVLYET